MKKIAVLLADGFEEVEGITPIDFLRRAGIEVLVIGVTGQVVTGGHGIEVGADTRVSELSDATIGELDGVVVPGGTKGAENIAASESAMRIVRTCLADGRLVAAICAAPGVVLGGHNLIGGRRFTCYPGFESRVEGGTFSEERVVEDGNLVTSRGAGTAAEFALAVIRRLEGREAAEQIRQGTLQPV